MSVLKNRFVLVTVALAVGAFAASCITPAGSAGQDRTYFACAGVGGVLDPTSLRIDNQPTCASGTTIQQWTQHADTSDLVAVTVERTGTAISDTVCEPVSHACFSLGGVTAAGTETALQCGSDCQAVSVRGTPYTLTTDALVAEKVVTIIGCDNAPEQSGNAVVVEWTCRMNGTHGAHVVVDYSPPPPG